MHVYLKSYYTNVNAIYEILYTNLYFFRHIYNKNNNNKNLIFLLVAGLWKYFPNGKFVRYILTWLEKAPGKTKFFFAKLKIL